MYTETIGRRILAMWRDEHDRPDATAQEYFDEVFFPLVFDHEDYLLFANNSKFDQASKQQKKTPLTPTVRREALASHHEAVAEMATRNKYESHLYLGGYASGVEGSTSGMVSDIRTSVNEEAIYATWLGQAAAIGVAGGMNVLIDDDIVIRRTVEGWTQYRNYLSQTEGLQGRQIQTWNAWWLMARGDEAFDPSRPLDNLEDDTFLFGAPGSWKLGTAPWVRVLFALTRIRAGTKTTAYVFSFGQSNTSVGFIGLRLGEVDELLELYVRLFGDEIGPEARSRMRRLFETDLGFISACRSGSIGLQQLRPKDLKKYVPSRHTAPKRLRVDRDELQQTFYITWLTAMLNNETLLQRADRLAEALHRLDTAKRGKKVNSALVNKLLESHGLRQFVEAATGILTGKEIDTEEFDVGRLNQVVEEVNALPASQFPLFITFLRFKYAFRAHQA